MTDRDAGYCEGIEAAAEIARQNKMHWANKVDPCNPDDPSRRLHSAKSAVAFQIEMDIRALPLPSTPDDGKAEPVAWIDFADNGNVRLWTHEKSRAAAEEAEGRKMTPVYLRPSPASDGAIREAVIELLKWVEPIAGDNADDAAAANEALTLERVKALLSAHAGDAAKSGGDDVETCIACAVPFVDGDMVYSDVGGGCLHEACCGPERECYVNLNTGDPIKDGEPIPKPWRWPGPPDTHAEVKG